MKVTPLLCGSVEDDGASSSSDPVLLQSTVERVRIITLNRPAARNALSSSLNAALFDALVSADEADDVDVIVLTGTDPAFCAGLDLKEAARDPEAFFRSFTGTDSINQVAKVKKPIIGAINGATFTGGLEIALGCDFLIASERAVFADTHGRVGVLPGGGMTARLPGAVGLRQARLMSMTGDAIDAVRAERLGLVAEVVPHDLLLERALTLARTMTEIAPETMMRLKRMYSEGSDTTVGEALMLERSISRDAPADLGQLGARRDAVMERNRSRLRDQ
jgi:enoyl-CoA hydratase